MTKGDLKRGLLPFVDDVEIFLLFNGRRLSFSALRYLMAEPGRDAAIALELADEHRSKLNAGEYSTVTSRTDAEAKNIWDAALEAVGKATYPNDVRFWEWYSSRNGERNEG